MKKIILPITLFMVTSLAPLTVLHAEDQAQRVYGWQLMTQEERAEHRRKMQSFNSFEEREAYRLEHHQRMQERAKERGVTLPDAPTPRGKGMGPKGQGMGPGMGPGGGNRGMGYGNQRDNSQKGKGN